MSMPYMVSPVPKYFCQMPMLPPDCRGAHTRQLSDLIVARQGSRTGGCTALNAVSDTGQLCAGRMAGLCCDVQIGPGC